MLPLPFPSSLLDELPTLSGLGFAGLLPVQHFFILLDAHDPFEEDRFRLPFFRPESSPDSIRPFHFRPKEETTIESFLTRFRVDVMHVEHF